MITREDINRSRKIYEKILTRAGEDSIYVKFRARCKEKKRSIKSVITMLIRKWLDGEIKD